MSPLVVVVVGPECSGKSTLAAAIAARFGGKLVHEHARTVLEEPDALARGWPALLDEIERGQAAAESAARAAVGALVVCDTDLLTTSIWSEALLGSCPSERATRASRAVYDLTLLCTPDLPWAHDPVRYLPTQQAWFFQRFVAELTALGRAFVVVSGEGTARMDTAAAAVSALLAARDSTLQSGCASSPPEAAEASEGLFHPPPHAPGSAGS